jgi:hypothetical protein
MKVLYGLALFICLLTGPAWGARIEGRVVFGDSPLAAMQVFASADLNPQGNKLAGPVLTDEQGYFQLDVETENVAIYAFSADGRYFAFCGRNPLRVLPDQKNWAGLQAVAVAEPAISPYADEYSAALEGVVVNDGEPLADAYVSLYLDAGEDLKGQGYRISAPTATDGYFSFDGLPQSSYYLVARKRTNASRVGPLEEGDMLGIYAGNPLSLIAGQRVKIQLPVVERQPFNDRTSLLSRAGAGCLEGNIYDQQQRPQAGLHAFAYRNKVIGHQRPDAISAITGTDGGFELCFGSPGVYYLGARQAFGDSPAPGELFGLYEGNADHSFHVGQDRQERIEIRVAPISLD